MRTFIVNIDDSLQGAEDDIDELERKWGAEEIEHKCHNCAHYLKGEYDSSCGSYICKNHSAWEQKDEMTREELKANCSKQMEVNILGTPYKIFEQTEAENPKLKDSNGLCEIYSKKIIIDKINIEDPLLFENIDDFRKKVLRHEIIHAFFAESGLRSSSNYAENEELVDWIAIQFPKIMKVLIELGAAE